MSAAAVVAVARLAPVSPAVEEGVLALRVPGDLGPVVEGFLADGEPGFIAWSDLDVVRSLSEQTEDVVLSTALRWWPSRCEDTVPLRAMRWRMPRLRSHRRRWS
jgi:hypothetical protein